MINRSSLLFLLFSLIFFSCSDDGGNPVETNLQLQSVNIGPYNLHLTDPTQNANAPINQPIVVTFTASLNIESVTEAVHLKMKEGAEVSISFSFQDNNKTIVASHAEELEHNQTYELSISDDLEGAEGETFPGFTVEFTTEQSTIALASVIIDGQIATSSNRIKDVDRNPTIEINFSVAINTSTINNTTIRLLGPTTPTLSFTFSDADKRITVTTNQTLQHLRRYTLSLLPEIEGALGEVFAGYSKIFYTELDPTPKLPLLPNDEDNDTDNTNDLLSVVQKQTFKYFYDFAHPTSGMARERNTSGNTVTSGGSGFGIMTLIVGMERNFITRTEGLNRMDRILDFLETADRFHGAWPHWMDGNTGNVIPFSPNDNGGDLVETSFLVQGLLTFRQYLNSGVAEENALINRINALYQGVEWDWYRRSNQNVLYWHWSPDKDWVMNHQIKGWNECLITYVLAAASPTHTIPKIVYDAGWASSGGMQNGNTYEGIQLPLGPSYGGPLFFSHYSFLGFDPRGLSDTYANYFTQNVNHSLINYNYCVRNPKNFVGYSDECWGLTASDNQQGYSAHSPTNDLGVITPTAALSSFPYTPTESMKALKFFYYTMGDRLWGTYGFYDAFNPTENWYATSTLAIDQAPIVVMIENYRTGLLWNLFMSAPEVQTAMNELDFN